MLANLKTKKLPRAYVNVGRNAPSFNIIIRRSYAVNSSFLTTVLKSNNPLVTRLPGIVSNVQRKKYISKNYGARLGEQMFTIARSQNPDNYKKLGKGPRLRREAWPLGKFLASFQQSQNTRN